MFQVVLEDQAASTPQNLVEAVNLLEKKEDLLRRLKWQKLSIWNKGSHWCLKQKG